MKFVQLVSQEGLIKFVGLIYGVEDNDLEEAKLVLRCLYVMNRENPPTFEIVDKLTNGISYFDYKEFRDMIKSQT